MTNNKLNDLLQIILDKYKKYIRTTTIDFSHLGTKVSIQTINNNVLEVWLDSKNTIDYIEKELWEVKKLRKLKITNLLNDEYI